MNRVLTDVLVFAVVLKAAYPAWVPGHRLYWVVFGICVVLALVMCGKVRSCRKCLVFDPGTGGSVKGVFTLLTCLVLPIAELIVGIYLVGWIAGWW